MVPQAHYHSKSHVIGVFNQSFGADKFGFEHLGAFTITSMHPFSMRKRSAARRL